MAAKPFVLSVKVIIHNAQGQCLLLRRSAASKNNAGKWEFPGGKIDPGEAFDTALLREVREETGLKVALERGFAVGQSDLPDRHVLYVLMVATLLTRRVRLSKEHDRFQWVLPQTFDDIDFSPQFRRMARRYAQEIAANEPPKETKSPAFATPSPQWLARQLAEFDKVARRYQQLAEWLKEVLVQSIKPIYPLAQIDARAKGVASFALKVVRKAKYDDPLRQITDLCGARVVVHLKSEVEAVGAFIQKHFHVDNANSLDHLSRLGSDRFGYRSVHFVVEIRPDQPAGFKIPKALVGLKAEIQVRTIAQHAWADIGHDRLYKTGCEIPDIWKREAARVAALLEAADEEFAHFVAGVADYQERTAKCPDRASTEREIKLLQTIRKHDRKNAQLALSHAQRAIEASDWNCAIRIVENFKGPISARLLCCKGIALCSKAQKSDGANWKQGIQALREAVKLEPHSVEPHLHLAEHLATSNQAEALEHYRQAFEIDPSNPAVLSGYVRLKVIADKSTSFVPLLRPDIERAIQRCRDLAAAGADVPQAFFRIAGFLQLLGPEHEWESLATLARAVSLTDSVVELKRVLAIADLFARHEPDRRDIECARRLLFAALKARQPQRPPPAGIAQPLARPLKLNGPVVIVAGACDPFHEESMRSYQQLLRRAFAGFRGTILSGGTCQGIAGVVGAIAASSKGNVRAIGYLPEELPDDATPDKRYAELRTTNGRCGFSAIEPLQNWLDLLASDVLPKDVRLLGINGGAMAGLEYRFALALDASVAVLHGSGREADRLVQEWPLAPKSGLTVLPRDPMTIRAFLHISDAGTAALSKEKVTGAAQILHRDFLEEQRYAHPDPVMQPWAKLRLDLQESNRSQIAYLESILRASGFGVRLPKGRVVDPKFTCDEIEAMAEMEHGRWNYERLCSGWQHGQKKDTQKKITPYLVPWRGLEDRIRKYDRKNVCLWPEMLADTGLEIYRLSADNRATSVHRTTP